MSPCWPGWQISLSNRVFNCGTILHLDERWEIELSMVLKMRAQHVAWCVTMVTAVCIPKITVHTHTNLITKTAICCCSWQHGSQIDGAGDISVLSLLHFNSITGTAGGEWTLNTQQQVVSWCLCLSTIKWNDVYASFFSCPVHCCCVAVGSSFCRALWDVLCDWLTHASICTVGYKASLGLFAYLWLQTVGGCVHVYRDWEVHEKTINIKPSHWLQRKWESSALHLHMSTCSWARHLTSECSTVVLLSNTKQTCRGTGRSAGKSR